MRNEKMLTHSRRPEAHTLPMGIGHKIKAARNAAGLSQRQLAARISVSAGLVGQWESHLKAPGRDVLVRVARITGKPLSYFIERVAPDAATLTTDVPDEIELIDLFRQLTPGQRRSHLELFRTSVALRAEIEQQREPAKG